MSLKHSSLLTALLFCNLFYLNGQSLDHNYIKSTEYLETVLVEDNFTSSFGGWLENGTVNYTLENGKIRANVQTSYEGIKNPLKGFKTKAGKTLKIKIDFNKGNTSSNVRLYLEERSPSGGLVNYNLKDGNLQTGVHEYTHLMNTSGNTMIFRIDKDNTNTGVETFFDIDYVSLQIDTNTTIDKVENITYFDGFGKAKQSIAIRQSPNQKDLAQHIDYDEFGRTTKQYLPLPSTQDTGNYINNAKSETESYYQNAFADQHPFAQIRYDNSPLNRKLESASPGNTWQLLEGSNNDHTTKYEYGTNSANEVLRIEISNNINKPLSFSYYSPHQLIENTIKNQNWQPSDGVLNTKKAFSDKNGKKIAEFNYEIDDQTIKTLTTYYVYDDAQNLRYVLTPKAFNTDLGCENFEENIVYNGTVSAPQNVDLKATNTITLNGGFNVDLGATFFAEVRPETCGITGNNQVQILNDLAFQYKYDQYNRQIEQKVPGKDWEYMVYDTLDRPILTQDSNLRSQNKWMFNKYDAYGRVVYSGIYITTATRPTLQTQVDNFINSGTNKANIETRTTTTNTIGGVILNYSNNAFPNTSLETLGVNYFDDYNFTDTNLPSIPTEILDQNVTTRTKGLLTASWTKTLEANSWTKDYTFYDDKGRVIYIYDKNHIGGFTKNESQLDFRGKVETSITTHRRETTGSVLTIEDTFEYDHVERPLKHFQKINNSQSQELIATNTYNELGQLITKGIGGTATNQLQTVNYTYNIRGWLTNINDVDNLGTDLFAYHLKYDTPTEGSAAVSNVYNGNIKQVIWKSAQNNLKKSYAFEYDKLNRFSKSVFRENNSLTGGAGKFETSNIDYDANGNIEALRRKNQAGALMDQLVYHYDAGNKLKSIIDTSTSSGFNNGSTGTSLEDYTYDTNGNLTQDLNKGINTIEYNHLDLVTRVTFFNGHKIEFKYNANGSKLQMKNIPVSGSPTTVDYLGSFQYTNEQLQFFPTPEGYVANDSGTYKYVYILRDHLGNNRVSFSDTNPDEIINPANEILSSTDHYVMGLTHAGEYIQGIASNYNYKYQGKEQLAFAGYNMYDFGSRMYDASVGRWFNADPQNQFTSPYLAMGNNWVMSVDPDGEFVFAAILLGATLGGMINGIMTDMAGGSFEEGFIKGAISGAVGAGAGAYVSTLSAVEKLGSGFYNGAIIGASGGFASGATASGLNGDNFGQILGNAGIGAGIGGAIGGLTAGLDAQSDGRDFWSGDILKSDSFEEIGGGILKKGDFLLDETIPAGAKPTDTGNIAFTKSNPDYGKYGWTRKYKNGKLKLHKGVDYSGNVGDNVYAKYDGTVEYVGPSKSYGSYFVRIKSTIGSKSYFVDYGHMSHSFVTKGQPVIAKDRIGLMGRLGNLKGTSYPTHVHISVFRFVNGNRGFVQPN